MDMTFSSWSDYQLDILFTTWNVETRWEYILSWWAVAFFALAYHAIRFLIVMIEDTMFLRKSNPMPPSTEQTPLMREDSSTAYSSYRQSLVETDVENGGCCDDSIYKKSDRAAASTGAGGRSDEVAQPSGFHAFWRKRYGLRLLHALLSGFNYGLALLLMLVAMTYNPGMFLALVFGYTIGDYLFFSRTRYSVHECH